MTTAAQRTETTTALSKDQLLRMYRRMYSIREFEEHANDLYLRALMPGLTHLYEGEEAVAVGICEALRPDDYITSTHRGHGHCLAKGAKPDRMFAELLGNGRICVCFFGEGALGQGVLYEAMNMAQLWKLPVVYACENNMYNEYTHYSETTAGEIMARPAAFGIPAETVDGQDVRAVHSTASRLVDRARSGAGPSFLLCNTYRYRGHHVGDINREYYRAKQEEQKWSSERDPINILGDWLIHQKIADLAQLERIQTEVKAEMNAAVEFAIAAPYPTVDEAEQDVYA